MHVTKMILHGGIGVVVEYDCFTLLGNNVIRKARIDGIRFLLSLGFQILLKSRIIETIVAICILDEN